MSKFIKKKKKKKVMIWTWPTVRELHCLIRHSQQCLRHRTLTREQVLTAVGIFHTYCSKILWQTGILLHRRHLSAAAALLRCLQRPSTHLLAQGECLLIIPESLCVACLQVVMSSEAELWFDLTFQIYQIYLPHKLHPTEPAWWQHGF